MVRHKSNQMQFYRLIQFSYSRIPLQNIFKSSLHGTFILRKLISNMCQQTSNTHLKSEFLILKTIHAELLVSK